MAVIVSTKDQIVLDSLFRDIVKFYSSSQPSVVTLQAIIEAVRDLECDESTYGVQIKDVCSIIANSQPRMFPIDNLIILFEKEMESKDYFRGKDFATMKTATIEILEDLKDTEEEFYEEVLLTPSAHEISLDSLLQICNLDIEESITPFNQKENHAWEFHE